MAVSTPSRTRNGTKPASVATTESPHDAGLGGVNVEIGLSGLNRQHGIVVEEFLPNLQGKRGVAVFKEMRDNDPIAGALLFAIEKMLRQVKWSVKKSGDSPEHEEAAQFLEECMNDMSMTWGDVISEAASMFPFGWALNEVCYKFRRGSEPRGGETEEFHTSKFDDGRIGWWKMPLRAQESLHEWEFGDNGGIKAMIQRPAPTYDERRIPIQKALLFRTSVHKGNPEGRSILRNAYRPWFFKKRIEEIEGVGVERDLAGLPVIKLPASWMSSSATPDQVKAVEEYKKLLVNVRRDKQEGIMLPSAVDQNGNQLVEFSLVSSGGTKAFDTDSIIVRYERAMAMTVLADWLMLGHTETGSWALSSDKTSLFSVALGAWLDMMVSVFNEFAVPRLFQLNGWKIDPFPMIQYGDIESPDLAALGSFILALAQAGMPLFPNEGLVKALLAAANLPEPTEDDIAAQEEERQAQEEEKELATLT